MEKMSVYAGLLAVQRDLKAPKDQYNSFGKYKYRSAENILSAARPLCNENGLVLLLQDSIEQCGQWQYCHAKATVIDIATGDAVSADGYAREAETKKGMDPAQVTGATSSYARKYALCGLFAIDDNKDLDSDEFHRASTRGSEKANTQAKSTEPAPTAEDRGIANRNLVGEVKRIGLDNVAMKNIIQRHFGMGKSTKDLTVPELQTLTTNLESWALF